jgi:hypothetical protein
MLKLKLNLTCSNCSQILKDPIELPCENNICKAHLTEKDVVKQKKIKCAECKQDFKIKTNEFKSNKILKQLIESQSYLNEEETRLKQTLEDSTRKLFRLFGEFMQSKNSLFSDVHNRFQEIRYEIDEHREVLKQKIDEISLDMIERTKKYEALYLQSLNETFQTSLNPILEDELIQIEETFRNPNLLIETIKDMQQKNEESLNEIQFKLNEMNPVRENLMALNDFKPNVSFSYDSFGSIYLNSYSNDPFKSDILTGKQSYELINLCEFSSNDKWSLLYRGSRDGFSAKNFHTKCDGHTNTLTIVKAKESSNIFGGFTTVDWESSSSGKYKSDPNAFLFSLTNSDQRPCKIRIDGNQVLYAIYCHEGWGPVFGNGHDVIVDVDTDFVDYKENDFPSTKRSSSNLGDTYKHAQYVLGTNEAQTFLAGRKYFELSEIEIYENKS